MTTTTDTDKLGRATERTWLGSQTKTKPAILGHIAIASRDPEATAGFFQEVFHLVKVRNVNEPYAKGLVLSDGFVELGLYQFSDAYLKSHDEIPGRSFESGFTGFHHLAFSTPDAAILRESLAVQGRRHGGDDRHSGPPELNPQYIGTDKVLFALTEKPWTKRESLGPQVARIRHMGIACQDPYSTMRFFRDTLGMNTTDKYMVYGGFADGYGGGDGNVQYALLRFNDPYQHAHDDSRGFKLGFAGVHHIGFYVNDLEETHRLLAEHHCPENMDIRAFLTNANKGTQYVVEEKYIGPERTSFEVSGGDWKVKPLDA